MPSTGSLHHLRAWILSTVIAGALFGLVQAEQEAPNQTTDVLIESIEHLEERIANPQLDRVVRSTAIDEAIDLREQLLQKAPTDRRRAIWHADQAEDLLLRRIEFPASWSKHLLNADQACPMMPPEIPLIVARGLEEASLARTSAVEGVQKIEADGNVLDSAETMTLLERLRFERDVRGPLLESIALVLASRVDPNAAQQAFEMLTRLKREQGDDASIATVVDRWLLLASIEAGKTDAIKSRDGGLASIDDDLDRVRAAIHVTSPRAAASLAARRHQMLPESSRYLQLLLADLRERALALEHASAPLWVTERGDLWIQMLDDPVGRVDWSLDGAIAPRLAMLSDRLGTESIPLAAAWALGERELTRRAMGENASFAARDLLERRIGESPADDPGRAHALSVLARLALADDDRLEGARRLEALYVEHPSAPTADPGRVADLLEPFLGSTDPTIAVSYERALRRSIESDSSSTDVKQRRTERLLTLAEHLSATDRSADALEIFEEIDAETPTIAARLIEGRARTVHQMLESGELDELEARKKHRAISAAQRSYTSRFGSAHTGLHEAGARAALVSVRSRMYTTAESQEDVRIVENTANDELLDPVTRIEAFITRHELRMASTSSRQEAITRAPDLITALRLDDSLARDLLLERALELLDELEDARERGHHLDAERIRANELRPFALAFDSGVPPSSNLFDRVAIARILQEGTRPNSALKAWDNLAQEHPTALEILLGRADALRALGDNDSLSEAIVIYRRLAQGQPGEFVPESTWWHAQLSQLLILEKVVRSLDRISPRIERLRLIDPELGGPRFREPFESLRIRLLNP